MTDDELEHLLTGAFDAKARSGVPDTATPPPPRFAQTATRRPHRLVRVLAPLTAAAAVIAVVSVVATVDHSAKHGTPLAGSGSTPAVTSSSSAPAGAPVRIEPLNADGAQYGVAMPVVAYFSKQITNAAPLAAATTVNVNGKPVTSAWYFEHSAAGHGPIEGHLRPETFWPAHAKITVQVATKGLSAGAGLVYSNAFTLNFRTGSADIATVDAVKHQLTLTVDGKRLGAYPVSLGSNQTPTRRGTKVIMSKGSSICMNGPGYNECGVKYTQRVTADGEYLHAAPWNTGNIKLGINSSNGCTNLTTADAKTLFNTLEVGDPVLYPNASGPVMPVSDGYGDWNVQWSTWLTGGLVPTH